MMWMSLLRPSMLLLTAIGLSFFFNFNLLYAQQSGSESTEPSARPSGVNLWQPGDSGERLYISGWVHDSDNRPIAGAQLRIWQADGDGAYQPDRYRTLLTTDEDGKYGFGTVVPGQYGGVKHIHIIVTHENYPPLETRILFIGDPYLDESTQRQYAIFLEETNVDDEKIYYGRFDIEMKTGGI
jgi:protocatechuate 3,4-dioxygenase beta subunit